MIGKICTILTPYYDSKSKQMTIKSRPALIIAQADSSDFNVLPVSKVSDKSKIDEFYDIPLDTNIYPLLNLTTFSYVRTHKQTTVNVREIGKVFGNMKGDYPDLYQTVVDKLKAYNERIYNMM